MSISLCTLCIICICYRDMLGSTPNRGDGIRDDDEFPNLRELFDRIRRPRESST